MFSLDLYCFRAYLIGRLLALKICGLLAYIIQIIHHLTPQWRIRMTENIWLADELTEDIDWDLVTLVSNSLNYDINKVRAFVVALLDDANDDAAAIQVNDILKAAE